jgi:hypothetical protein
MIQSIFSRLKKLERGHGGESCGPGCPPLYWRFFREESPSGQRILESEEGSAVCPKCARPAKVFEVVEFLVFNREEADAAIDVLCAASSDNKEAQHGT